MADISKAFSVENGISLNDEVGIFDGAADPSISGEAAPLGSLYIRLNGQLFQKTGSNLTDWSKFALGASGLLNVSATDTTPGFLNSKLTFTSEFVKTVLNPSANESISVSLANSGVTAGTYKSLTVNSKGIVTAGTNPTTLVGYGITDAQPLDADLTAIAALVGTTGLLRKTASNTWSLDTTAYLTGNQTVTLSGAITGSGTTTITTALANSGVTAGTYKSVTVTATGLVTGGTNPTTLAGYGISDAASSTHNHQIDTLSNVTITSKATNDLLQWNGTAWVNKTIAGAGLQPAGSYLTGNQTITLSGDITGAGSTAITTVLANSGITAGTYRSVTINAKGIATGGTNPTTLTGYGITDAQPLDATLTSLAALNTTGFIVEISPDVFTGRVISGTANQIDVSNGNGVSGSPVLSLPSTGLAFPGTSGVVLPNGTTAQRSAVKGTARLNTDSNTLEYFNGTSWVTVSGGGSGTVTSVGLTAPFNGITVSGSPITNSGSITLALANDLAALENLSLSGFAVRTGTDTWNNRTISGIAGKISVTNGNGVAGDPQITIDSTYQGQSSITTVGTITSGVWNGTAVSALNGGTGLSGVGGANNLLCTNTAANGLEYRTLSAGSGISISQGTGSITISATAGAGVSSLAGTANQISVSAPTGSVTLSLASNPTIPGVQKLTLPVGATADRPSFGSTGDIRYNSTLGYPELFNNTNWVPLGRVLQDLSGPITSTSGTGLIPMDTTIPQITEGYQILSVAITPVSTASKIRFRTSFNVSAGTAGRYVTAALFLNGAANAVGAATSYIVTVNTGNVLVLAYEMNNFDLNVKTFTLRLGANSAATSYIGRAGANTLGGVFSSRYELLEIK